MAKQFKTTKLAIAVGVAAVSLGLSATANAVIVVGGDNGWEVSFDGNINAMYTVTDFDAGFTSLGYDTPTANGTRSDFLGAGNATELDSGRVTSGYLPAFFSFNVKSPTVKGITATGRMSFAPVIQNANQKNQMFGGTPGNGGFQGSSMDVREVVVNVEGQFGTLSFGRTLSIFGRQAMLKDQTLFGVGAPNKQSGGIAGGRTGRGYTYPNFNARFSFTTPMVGGFQAEFGLYDPSQEQRMVGTIGGENYAGILDETDTPRFEGELKYTTAFDSGSIEMWIDGLWQDIESSKVGSQNDVTVAAFGAGADIKFSGFNVLGYYYTGSGLGRSLQFTGGTRCDSTGNRCQEVNNKGYYFQGSYMVSGKTKVATSYGKSSEDGFRAVGVGLNNQALNGTRDVDMDMWTVGVYHDMNSWVKLIAEYSSLENDYGRLGASSGAETEADAFTLGTFLFW